MASDTSPHGRLKPRRIKIMKSFKQGQMVARQGDVGFLVGNIPGDAKRIPLRPFALGEVTGHSHRVAPGYEDAVEMYEGIDGEIYVRITGAVEVPVIHEDHDPDGTKSLLPAGYEGPVRIAREYDEETDFRRVVD
jgi:hypothetical protein